MTLILAIVALAYALPDAFIPLVCVVIVMFTLPYIIGGIFLVLALPVLLAWDATAYGCNRVFGTHWPRVGKTA